MCQAAWISEDDQKQREFGVLPPPRASAKKTVTRSACRTIGRRRNDGLFGKNEGQYFYRKMRSQLGRLGVRRLRRMRVYVMGRYRRLIAAMEGTGAIFRDAIVDRHPLVLAQMFGPRFDDEGFDITARSDGSRYCRSETRPSRRRCCCTACMAAAKSRARSDRCGTRRSRDRAIFGIRFHHYVRLRPVS
jgi:hypothetical protein